MQIRSVLVHFHSAGYITLNLPHSFTGVASYTPLPQQKKNLKKSSSAKSANCFIYKHWWKKDKKKTRIKSEFFFKAAVGGCKVADVYKLSEVQVDFVG